MGAEQVQVAGPCWGPGCSPPAPSCTGLGQGSTGAGPRALRGRLLGPGLTGEVSLEMSPVGLELWVLCPAPGAGCAPAAGEPCWPAGRGRAARSWGLPCPLLGREARALLSLPMPFVPSASAVCPLLLGGQLGTAPSLLQAGCPGDAAGAALLAQEQGSLLPCPPSLPCLPCPVLLCPPCPLSVPFFSVPPPCRPRRSAGSRRSVAPHRSLLAAGPRAGGAAGRPFWGLPLPCRTAGTPPQPHRAGAAPRGLPAAARAPGRPGELPWRRDTGLGAARRRLGPPPAPTAGSWGWGWRGGCSWRSRGADPLGTGSPRKGCGWRWGHLAAPRPRTTARG